MSGLIVLLGLMISSVLVSCGGGGGDGGGSVANSTGVFIDSPVQGLPYRSTPSGVSGLTGPNGEFQYRAGDRVEFHIGTQLIGDAPGQPQITPFTLLARTSVPSVTHEWPVNVAQLLLALDTVPGTDTITLPTMLPTIPSTTCFVCPNFDTELATANISIVPEADAIAHLQKQFAIWGSWVAATTPNKLQVITFMPDGAFILAHDDDPNVSGDANGMEGGTYHWNAATNALTYTVTMDTDGTGGLSHLSASQTPYTFVIDSSGNGAVLHFGPNVSDQLVFTRVVDTNTSLVGAWKYSVPQQLGFYTVITFLPDGTFTLANGAFDIILAGMERGTYLYDAIAGMLTFTTTVDTNGIFGVNESPTPSAPSVFPAKIGEALGQFDFLTITEAPNEFVNFDRVRVP